MTTYSFFSLSLPHVQQQNYTSPLKNDNDASASASSPLASSSKQRYLRGLVFSSPLNGKAFGGGFGTAFSNGNTRAKSDIGGGASTANGVSAGGGYGGGLGYVETTIGSAYGGGSGGANTTSIRSEYGMTTGASTYAINGADANSTFRGDSYGAGQGKGMFGGLYNFTLDPVYYYYTQPEPPGSYSNKTGGGGSGYSTTGTVTKGNVKTIPFIMGYSGATGSVASAAAGYGFGGGSLKSGNNTIAAGGAGGGDVLADALGFAFAGFGQEVSEAEFNATGDAVADGGAYGYVGDVEPGNTTAQNATR
jgi:hypothetical protein